MKARSFSVLLLVLGLTLSLAWAVSAQAPDFAGPPRPESPCAPGDPCNLLAQDDALWQKRVESMGQATSQAAALTLPPTPASPDVLATPWQQSPDGAYQTLHGEWVMPQGAHPDATAAGLTPQSTGGPDDFGYTWDDSVPLNWIDATTGTDTGMGGSSSGQKMGPVTLPFPFKYYENSYSSLYVAASGYLAFTDEGTWPWQSQLPSPGKPNNVVAPYWTPLDLATAGPSGRVYYKSGGVAPNRYFTVEWYQATRSGQTYTFEVILYENSDIVFQYQAMGSVYTCGAAGIEDSTGLDGLSYVGFCNQPPSNKAVRFLRPPTAARVSITPLYQGRFTRAGETVASQLPIRNTGELGADTYDLTTASVWPIALYAADGITPLVDTDGDGKVDTGSIAQGGVVTVVAKVQTPGAANVGKANTASVIVRSSRDAAKSKIATLQTAVPAPFAQVYRDDADGAMSLFLAQPAGQATRKTTADGYSGSNMAVAETPAGAFVYAWSKGRSVGNVYVSEIEYTLLDRVGVTVRPVSRLTDHSGATVQTSDYPVVAVAPNGRIGVLWYRYLYNSSNGRSNYNLYFAVLDAAGNIAVPPTNLTNNDLWGTSSNLNVPRFFYPRIVATGDNRFVLAWLREHQESAGYVDDIYYAVRNSSGEEARGITRLTDDLPGSGGYSQPALAPLSTNRAFLSWLRSKNSDDDIFYAVLDSVGNQIKGATDLSIDESVVDWGNYDAVQLSDGKILAVWEAWGCVPGEWTPRIRFALLDDSYNRSGTPTCLGKTAAATAGDTRASVAADADGHASITWMDRDSRRNLYYALVDGAGSILTPPMIFRTSQATSPYIETSSEGYGNTSYSWTPPAAVDAYVTAASPISGTIGGYAAVPLIYGNVGGPPATSVWLAVTLGPGLTYAGDTSGVTPTVDGNLVRWNLPNLAFLERREFRLFVQLPHEAAAGTHYSINLNLSAAGSEANPADNSASLQIIASPPPGGPDDFGYTWDDAAPFNWIDATAGTDTGIVGDDRTGLVEIGFPFKFYEQTWSQVYVSTNGILVFGQDNHGCCGTVMLPLPSSPNNVIAPFWDDLTIGSPYNNGAIYTLGGGAAPNRYLVVQWRNATRCCNSGATDYKTFQVILHENGDIVTQYQGMAGSLSNGSVGIEDSTGTDGLKYTGAAANGKAVRFYRPGPAARVKAFPLYQGQFTHAGALTAFQVPVINTGEVGADTYDLATISAWPATLYAADGVTPLGDSDHDGVTDIGPIAAGNTATVTIKIQTPPGANVGANNAARLTARSSLNTAKSKTVTLQSAVPAPFAQVYRDYADGAMNLYLAQSTGQVVRPATANGYPGSYPAVAETPAGAFVYAWSKGRSVGNVYVSEIEYTLLDRLGDTVRPAGKLTDHTGATVSTYDTPVVAAAPDGRIGVLWYRYLYNQNNGQRNYNIYFTVLDAAGNVVVPPINLTNNSIWGTSSDLNVPTFSSPRIVATGDNRFVLAWFREHQESAGYVDDIYYAVRGSSGNEVRGITKFTNDIPDYNEGYYYPNLAALSGNRALLTWYRGSDRDIYYAVLDSSGNIVRDAMNLVGDGSAQQDYRPDAAQLADGKVLVAWTSWTSSGYPNYRIRFAVLDAAWNRIAGPIVLDAPAALTGSDYVSIAADANGRAILTWMDWNYRANLYYALVDGIGSVLTPPTIFRTSQATSPSIVTSYEGYGNTSYSWRPPAGVDGVVAFGAPAFPGAPGKAVRLNVSYANHGATPAGVTLSAVLNANLAYVSDTAGVTPTVSGQSIAWHLPEVGLLESRTFWLAVQLPVGAPIGASYPITLTLTSAGPEVNPGDNTATAEVIVARQEFLPLVLKR